MSLDPRWRKVQRDLWLHRARTLLVVTAVALGLIGAGSILNAWALVRRATIEGFLGSLPVSATLTVDRIDAELLAQVRALPEIAAARSRRTVSAAVQSGGAWHSALLFALDDFEQVQIARLQTDASPWPPGPGELLIERSALELSGASIGETLSIKLAADQVHTVKLVGSVRDVSLAPGWMDHVVYAFLSSETLTSLGAPAGFNQLQLRVRDAEADQATVRRIAWKVKDLIEARGITVERVEVPVPGEHMHAAQMDSLLLTQGAFGLLCLLVCAFLIVNLIRAMLAGQTREIAVMKTCGASSAQIARLYLGMALLLGLLAALIALPVALLIGRAYAGFRAEMLNFPIAGIATPWWAIALQLLVACALPVLAAWLPVSRACRMSIGAALRDIGIVSTGSSLHARRLLKFGGFSRPLLLSIGNAFRRRQRMLLTLLALATGGAVFLGAQNLRASVIGSVDLLFASQRFDFSLRLAEAQAVAELEKRVMAVSGVRAAEAWSGARALVQHADGTRGDGFALTALPATTQMLQPALAEGRWLHDETVDELVISRALLKAEPGLLPGTTVSLWLDGEAHDWLVVGVVDGGTQPTAWVSRQRLHALRGNTLASTIVVSTALRGIGSQLDLIQRLRQALDEAGMAVASSQRPDESRRTVEDHLLMVVQFLSVMGWIMIIVGGMGLASTMSLSVLERTREIGVLRAIGASHGSIQRLIQIEGLVITLLGWLLSLPLSIPMSVLLADAFGRIMFRVPIHYLPSVPGAFSWLLLSVLVCLLACAWPARRATRISTAQALSYE